MRRLTFLACLLGLGFLAPPLRGEAPTGSWTQVDDDDGIKVWRLEIPGKDLPGFRGEAVMAAPASAIVAVLKKIEHHTQWMHRCVASEPIKRFDDDHVIIYNRTAVPWPVWDRDVVLDTLFTYAADGRLTTLTFKHHDPSLWPLPERVVRMPRLEGFYRLWQLAPNQTKVLYQVEADVGGSLPTWMAERVARDMPYETLSRLRERVTRSR